MASNIPLTLKGKLVWIGLIVFVAVWMFVLGIMVGRGTAPISLLNQSIDDGLMELKAAIAKPTPDRPDDPAEENIEMTDLKFYEDLKETQTSVRPMPAPSQPAKKVAAVPPQPAGKTAVDTAKVLQAPDAHPQPATAKPSAATPAAVQKGAAPPATAKPTSHYTVQVAAVQEARNADQLVEDLRRKGFDAYQVRNQSQNGSTWYRIRIGAFEDRSAAEAALAGLQKSKITGMVLQTP